MHIIYDHRTKRFELILYRENDPTFAISVFRIPDDAESITVAVFNNTNLKLNSSFEDYYVMVETYLNDHCLDELASVSVDTFTLPKHDGTQASVTHTKTHVDRCEFSWYDIELYEPAGLK